MQKKFDIIALSIRMNLMSKPSKLAYFDQNFTSNFNIKEKHLVGIVLKSNNSSCIC